MNKIEEKSFYLLLRKELVGGISNIKKSSYLLCYCLVSCMITYAGLNRCSVYSSLLTNYFHKHITLDQYLSSSHIAPVLQNIDMKL